MSNLDADGRPVVETTTYADGSQTRTVRAGGSQTGYWVAGAVAIVAILAVAFMVWNNNQAAQTVAATPDPAAVSTAYQQGQAQGQADTIAQTAAQQAAAQAALQNAANQSAINNQAAVQSAAATDAANRAAARAQRAADQAAAQAQAPSSNPPADSSPQQ